MTWETNSLSETGTSSSTSPATSWSCDDRDQHTLRKILWTGTWIKESPNVSGAKPVECDILCLEGTYGGKYHPDRKEEEQRFVDRVLDVVVRGSHRSGIRVWKGAGCN